MPVTVFNASDTAYSGTNKTFSRESDEKNNLLRKNFSRTRERDALSLYQHTTPVSFLLSCIIQRAEYIARKRSSRGKIRSLHRREIRRKSLDTRSPRQGSVENADAVVRG